MSLVFGEKEASSDHVKKHQKLKKLNLTLMRYLKRRGTALESKMKFILIGVFCHKVQKYELYNYSIYFTL